MAAAGGDAEDAAGLEAEPVVAFGVVVEEPEEPDAACEGGSSPGKVGSLGAVGEAGACGDCVLADWADMAAPPLLMLTKMP